MSNRHGDIKDDEIRIISSRTNSSARGKRRIIPIVLWIFGSMILIGVFAIFFFSVEETESDEFKEEPKQAPVYAQYDNDEAPTARAYVVRTDTVVGGVMLSILTPVNATPVLEIGNDALKDSTVVMMAQAADVRKDNGGIVGAYVVNGDLVSKGEAKAGFCSIINGEVTLGVADATPMLEQALMNDGYFFRQYPLVVGGQIVENKPKGSSIRKALAEINGDVSIVISQEKITFHEFSQALIDVGAGNAIYLVGGDAYSRYRDADDKSFTIGKAWDNDMGNVNYIVWR